MDGRGGKDHSWGPRNWHAKIYLRWLIASFDDDYGFMLVRAVGPSKKTRSGYVWSEGSFHLVDDFQMRNEYAGSAAFRAAQDHAWRSSAGTRTGAPPGLPQAWVPLRHRQTDAQGKPALLRIVKSPTDWVAGDGRRGEGMCEYHDLHGGRDAGGSR